MVQSGILLETQLHYIGTSTLIIDVYQKESEIEEKSLQEMFCYLVPKYSTPNIKMFIKKKAFWLHVYHPTYPTLSSFSPILAPAPLTPC